MLRIASLSLLVVLVSTGCALGAPEPSAPQPTATSLTPDRTDWPAPPRIPADFTWSGRYLVPDLGIGVPFTWHGDGGDVQMVAGGPGEPIHFTNVIAGGELYTLTYEWPDIPRMPCSHVGAFTVDDLNAGFAEASYVGRVTLHRDVDHEVHHFRSVDVLELPPGLLDGLEGVTLRMPVMAGDIYVDVDDASRLRQLLHFGLQNLYDPNLDEWIVIDSHSNAAGAVALPEECTAP